MIPIGIPDQKYKNSPTIVTSIGGGMAKLNLE